jgi:hypothetical protein
VDDIRRGSGVDHAASTATRRDDIKSFRPAAVRRASSKGIIMSRKTLVDLQKSHQALEDQLAEAMLHKAVDDLEIVDLKRRKLQIKDEIERLRREVDKG